MRFEIWLAERSERDATKKPKTKTNRELQMRAATKNMHGMQHGRAGTMDYDKQKGSKGRHDREAIDRSERGD